MPIFFQMKHKLNAIHGRDKTTSLPPHKQQNYKRAATQA